jgi:hypothetical protein
MAHAFAKVVLQNVYRFVHPMNVPSREIAKFRSCFAVLDTSDERVLSHLAGLSRDRCGDAGLDKILLFIYLFNIIECRRLETMKLFREYMGILDTGLPRAIRMEDPLEGIALFRGEIGERFRGLRERIIGTIREQRLTWITFTINNDATNTPQLQRILQNILSLGLYVFMGMKASEESIQERMVEGITEEEARDVGHAVIMVKYNNGEYTTVGSYGEGVETTRDVNKLRLGRIVYDLSHYKFILPIYDGEIGFDLPTQILSAHMRDLERWSYDYVERIQTTRTLKGLENLFTANEEAIDERFESAKAVDEARREVDRLARNRDRASSALISRNGRAYLNARDRDEADAIFDAGRADAGQADAGQAQVDFIRKRAEAEDAKAREYQPAHDGGVVIGMDGRAYSSAREEAEARARARTRENIAKIGDRPPGGGRKYKTKHLRKTKKYKRKSRKQK